MRERRRTWKLLCKIRPIEIDRVRPSSILTIIIICASFSRHCASIGKPTAETCLLSIANSRHRNKGEQAEASIDGPFPTDRSRPKQTEQGLDWFNSLCSGTDARAGLVCSNAAMSQTCASRCRHISPV
ncbi:hypothetical protein CI102_8783 [Trichoderma harzianum]|nr:hypothetical protein CI102_8783 [Trichoderma harzianum]